MDYYGETIESVHYTLDGGLILAETHYGTYGDFVRRITYSYDESGSPVSLIWDGTEYYYYKNIFGDILGIMDGTGTLVVRYTYDAWGRNISRTGSMASTLGYYNPYRYRSYYYDRETGLYYLQARYYDPTIGRFISPDPVLDTTNAIGCNPYAYCGNDPVNRVDPTGRSWVAALIFGIVAVACIASLSGCTPSTGDAPDYVEIGSSNGDRDKNPNCYSYAIGYYDRSYNPGDFSTPYTAMTLDAVGNAVMRDMEALGRGCRPLEAHNSPIKNNEYRIALKVSEPKILVTESGLFVDWDYHFMVQTSSGQWAEKHGPAGATILYPSGNPSTISWDLGDQIGYYTEGPLYFAITH